MNAIAGERFCALHAPAPNLGPLMHKAFSEHQARPTADELQQFANKHYPNGDHVEIRRRVETFYDRVHDGKRRRLS